MITVELADNEHFALRCPYDERERVKSLGTYPDVRWDATGRRWLLHCALWGQVVSYLADAIAPIDPDVAMALPIYKPKPVRKTARDKQREKYEEKRQLKQWGKFTKELKKWGAV